MSLSALQLVTDIECEPRDSWHQHNLSPLAGPQLFLYGSHFTDFLIYGTYNAVDTHSQMHKNVLHLHISLMDLKRLQNALDVKVGYL